MSSVITTTNIEYVDSHTPLVQAARPGWHIVERHVDHNGLVLRVALSREVYASREEAGAALAAERGDEGQG